MNPRRWGLVLAIFAGLSAPPSTLLANAPLALSDEERAALDSVPVLRIASDPNREPYSFRSPAGRFDGYFPVLLARAAQLLNRSVEYLPVADWGEAQQRFESGEGELILGISPSPERLDLLTFGEVLATTRSVIYGREDVPSDPSGTGLRIALPLSGSDADRARERFPAAQFLASPSLEASLGMIVAGEADFTVGNPVTLAYAARKRGYANLRVLAPLSDRERSIHLAARKADAALLSAVGKALLAIPAPEIDALRAQWFGAGAAADPAVVERLTLSDTEQAVLAQTPRLRVACQATLAPLSLAGLDGRCDGLTIELLRAAAERVGLSLVERPAANFAQGIASFEQGEVDALLPVVKTAAREAQYAFTEPLISLRSLVLARREQRPVESIAEIQTLRFAQVRDTTESRSLQQAFPSLTVQEYDTVAAVLTAIMTGQADATVGNPLTATYEMRRAGFEGLHFVAPSHEPIRDYYVMAQGALAPVVDLINRGLAAVPEAEKDRIRARWVQATTPEAPQPDASSTPILRLSSVERAWIERNPVVQLGVDRDFAPIEYVDAQGRYTGLVADLLELLAARTGLQFEPRLDLDWSTAYQEGVEGRLDGFPDIWRTPERELHFDFIGPYLTLPQVIVVRNDFDERVSLSDLRGRRMAVPLGYAEQSVLERDYPEIELALVDSLASALSAVAVGDADATLVPLPIATFEIQRQGLINLRIAARSPFRDVEAYFAINKDRPVLASIIRKALSDITEAEWREMGQRWFSDPDIHLGTDWRRLSRQALNGALVLAALALLALATDTHYPPTRTAAGGPVRAHRLCAAGRHDLGHAGGATHRPTEGGSEYSAHHRPEPGR